MATKKDLIDRMLKKANFLEPSDVKFAVDCIINQITQTLLEKNRVEIRGFGSISIRSRKYPKTLKSYHTVYYRMSKNVQTTLNSNKRN
ncbi:MAG: HU family DNA-binding protein [Rickettsiaceae bacterium]|nr:HU family DNA-binding protein [Rickettsiaceae bacterium]